MQTRLAFTPPVTRLRRAITAVALGATLGVVACGGGGGGSSSTGPTPTPTPNPVTPAPASNGVSVVNNSFDPNVLTVAVGSTVTWTWNTCNDPGYGGTMTCVSHNIVWDADGTGSGLQSQGTYARTFNAAGTYAYHCAVHGAAMSGTIKVQ